MTKTPEQLATALVERALPCELTIGCDWDSDDHTANCPAAYRPAVIEAVLPVVRENVSLRKVLIKAVEAMIGYAELAEIRDDLLAAAGGDDA